MKYSKDSLVSFDDDTHTYTHISNGPMASVSSIVKKFKQPFSDNIAKFYSVKHGLNEQEVRNDWKKR